MRAMLDTIHEISVALASAAWGVAGPHRHAKGKTKSTHIRCISKEATHRPAQT